MPNPEHLAILKEGVERWNAWRRENQVGLPDLTGADLATADLAGADLAGADLAGAYLTGANLEGAHLRWTNLHRADLAGAHLSLANLSEAHLRRANLRAANLFEANLRAANLRKANVEKAFLFDTIFADTDLTGATGLDQCIHVGPSTIDHRTLAKSGTLPLAFLRGCGLPQSYIDYLPSLLGKPFEFYSLFISYSSQDDAFTHRLHADLQDKGVRCYFAPEDMKIGDEIRPAIVRQIRLRDKLLLILSEHSIESRWVKDEVEAAYEEEDRRGETVLFPIRLDNAVMDTAEAWAAKLRRQRHIGDFTDWKDHDAYQSAFDRLLRDLKA